jgi:hypothetical protein
MADVDVFDDYVRATGLDRAFLKSIGVRRVTIQGRDCVRVPYEGGGGGRLFCYPSGELSRSEAMWDADSRPRVYQHLHSDTNFDALPLDLLVTDNEIDCQTLWQNKIRAVCVPEPGVWTIRQNRGEIPEQYNIYIACRDARTREGLIDQCIEWRHRNKVWVIDLPGQKSLNEIFRADPSGFTAEVERLIQSATSLLITAQKRYAPEMAGLGALRVSSVQEIAQAERILPLLTQSVADAGVAGESRVIRMLYLTMTSRLLAQPVSVALKGAPSSGKSFILKKVCAHFPDEAFVFLSGMSGKALIYLPDKLAHKHIILAEARGAADRDQRYMIGTLLSEGRLVWHAVDNCEQGRITNVHRKDGPTGLIYTSNEWLEDGDLAARMIPVSISDFSNQTRRVLSAAAVLNECRQVDPVWPAFQTWLAEGERRVHMPYAKTLALLCSDASLRMRRYFSSMLSLVCAHALLHRENRERTDDGQIIANLDDYEEVFYVASSLLSEAMDSMVPVRVRETIQVVKYLSSLHMAGVSASAIATALGVERVTAWRRCREAVRSGYLGVERSKGRMPAQYYAIDEVPVEDVIFPSRQTLELSLQASGPAEKLDAAA